MHKIIILCSAAYPQQLDKSISKSPKEASKSKAASYFQLKNFRDRLKVSFFTEADGTEVAAPAWNPFVSRIATKQGASRVGLNNVDVDVLFLIESVILHLRLLRLLLDCTCRIKNCC